MDDNLVTVCSACNGTGWTGWYKPMGNPPVMVFVPQRCICGTGLRTYKSSDLPKMDKSD